MKSARERMDVISAYREVGTYRGAAAICGTTHKTVKRIIEAHESAGAPAAPKAPRARNYDEVTDLVAKRVTDTAGRITAKRLLPEATAAGYDGSARNFRRLVADAKQAWRNEHAGYRGRRPAVWTPGETLMIDWGELRIDGVLVHVFCAVLAWSRFRFVRFAVEGNGREPRWLRQVRPDGPARRQQVDEPGRSQRRRRCVVRRGQRQPALRDLRDPRRAPRHRAAPAGRAAVAACGVRPPPDDQEGR